MCRPDTRKGQASGGRRRLARSVDRSVRVVLLLTPTHPSRLTSDRQGEERWGMGNVTLKANEARYKANPSPQP